MSDSATSPRSYWPTQMDAAYSFMQTVAQQPVIDCGEPLRCLKQATQDAGVEVTFSDKPHVNGLPRLYYLREGLIADFVHIAEAFNRMSWRVHVEDGYRTPAMQAGLWDQPYVFDVVFERVTWELNGAEMDPTLLFKRIAAMVAMSPLVGTHVSGSAIDVTLCDRKTGEEIDRGGSYLEMSHLTPMTSPFVSPEAAANRKRQEDRFAERGFRAYPYEFWHFNQGDIYDVYLNNAQTPARYGPVEVDFKTGQTTPLQNADKPFKTHEQIMTMIQTRLEV